MQIIEVAHLKEATICAVDIVLSESLKYESVFNIAFTGGRFGKSFAKELALKNINYENWQIFQKSLLLLEILRMMKLQY